MNDHYTSTLSTPISTRMSVFSHSSDEFNDAPPTISSPLMLCRSLTLSDEIALKEAEAKKAKESETDEFNAWFNVYLILEKKAVLTIAERTYARQINDIPNIKKAIAHCENIIAYRESVNNAALIQQARDGTSPNISAEGGEFY